MDQISCYDTGIDKELESMTSNDVNELLNAVFARSDFDKDTLLAQWNWDSLARVLLTAEFQERFDLDVTAEEMSSWIKVSDLVDFTLEKMGLTEIED